MPVLFTSLTGSGHWHLLVPFAEAPRALDRLTTERRPSLTGLSIGEQAKSQGNHGGHPYLHGQLHGMPNLFPATPPEKNLLPPVR